MHSVNWQEIAVVLIVAFAAWHVWRVMAAQLAGFRKTAKPGTPGCGGCSGCSDGAKKPATPQLITLSAASPRRVVLPNADVSAKSDR